MVTSTRYVDEVVVYRGVDELVKEIDFEVFAKGPDQNHEGFCKAEAYCRENGKQVVIMPRTEGVSSSQLKELIKSM